MARSKKLTHEDKVKALTPPKRGFIKDKHYPRILPKSQYLQDLEAKQVLEVEIVLPDNVSKIRR